MCQINNVKTDLQELVGYRVYQSYTDTYYSMYGSEPIPTVGTNVHAKYQGCPWHVFTDLDELKAELRADAELGSMRSFYERGKLQVWKVVLQAGVSEEHSAIWIGEWEEAVERLHVGTATGPICRFVEIIPFDIFEDGRYANYNVPNT